MAQNDPTNPPDQSLSPSAETTGPPGWTRHLMIALALLAASAMLAEVWAVPRPIGDLYVALAAGRDVAGGKFGAWHNDHWSFMTGDRIWVNQNWGTHLVNYLSYAAFGEAGLLILKAAILIAIAAWVTLAARRLGTDWPIGLLVGASVLLGVRSYIDLRPNLTSLFFTPLVLWLLYRSRGKPHNIWPAMIAIWLWSAMHGGFVFGLGLLGLWSLLQLLPHLRQADAEVRRRIKAKDKDTRRHPPSATALAAKTWWPFPAASAGAILLATFATPFPLTGTNWDTANLTHSMVVGASDLWRGVQEWHPIFPPSAIKERTFGQEGAQVFYAFLIITALLLSVRGYIELGKNQWWTRVSAEALAVGLFQACILLLTIVMAMKARRFIPLAILVAAPVLAMQLHWLLRPRRWPWATMIAAAAALVYVIAVDAPAMLNYYSPDNPLHPRESVLQRMLQTHSQYPTRGVEFLNANDIAGPTINEWRWEGYLQWKCPQLQFYIGGRAQQVYSEEHYRRWLMASGMPGPRGQALLAEIDAVLAVVPPDSPNQIIVRQLLSSRSQRWAAIYFDGDAVILARADDPRSAGYVQRALGGALSYPDEESAALSQLMLLETVGPPAAQVRQAALEAIEVSNHYHVFQTLALTAEQNPTWLPPTVELFEARLGLLQQQGFEHPKGMDDLTTARFLAEWLARHYATLGQAQRAESFAAQVEALNQRSKDFLNRYRARG